MLDPALNEFIAQEIMKYNIPDDFSPTTNLNHAFLAIERSGKYIIIMNKGREWIVKMSENLNHDINSPSDFKGYDLPLLICRVIVAFFSRDKTSILEAVSI